MKKIIFVLVLASLVNLTYCASGVGTQDDCICEEESSNGYYCKKWICEVNNKCFMGESKVTIFNDQKKMIINMNDLKVGDCVQDSFQPEECSLVTFISHKEEQDQAYFARIISENNIAYATFEHLIPITKKFSNDSYLNKIIQVKNLQLGDLIWTKFGLNAIQEIQYNKSTGIFSPHTKSGYIIVDNTLFSTYASVNNHDLSHLFFSWYNLLRIENNIGDIKPNFVETFLTNIATKIF